MLHEMLKRLSKLSFSVAFFLWNGKDFVVKEWLWGMEKMF